MIACGSGVVLALVVIVVAVFVPVIVVAAIAVLAIVASTADTVVAADVVTDLEDGAGAPADGGDFEEGAHGVGDASLLADHAAHVAVRDSQVIDDVVIGVFFGYDNSVRVVDDRAGHEFDEIFHCGYLGV